MSTQEELEEKLNTLNNTILTLENEVNRLNIYSISLENELRIAKEQTRVANQLVKGITSVLERLSYND